MGQIAAAEPVISTIASALTAIGTAKSLIDKPDKPKPARQVRPPAPQAQTMELPQEEEFIPRRPEEMQRPESLNELAAFSPIQQRSALATRGLNVGLGTDESEYHKNLLQRTLIGQGGQIPQDTSALLPIESQYFSQQGLPTGDIKSLLKSLR